MNRNYTPRPETKHWSETRWVGSWNPNSNVGLWVHAGRCRGDLGLWWVQVVVYLPDGQLVVDRSFSRGLGEPDTPPCAGLRLEPDDKAEEWIATFDGAGESTTTAKLATHARGSGVAQPLRWTLSGKAAAPAWSPLGESDNDSQSFGDRHMQRTAEVQGELAFGGKAYPLDGVGFVDHSGGPRSFTDHSGHLFVCAVMPGFVIHAMTLYNMDGTPKFSGGAIIAGDTQTAVARVESPPAENLLGAPQTFDLAITDTSGAAHHLRIDVLHTAAVTMTNENHNLIGIDWDNAADTLVLTECPVRITTQDGAVGYGHIERANRRREFDPTSGAKLPR
jgi:hypothetical protein